MEEYLHGALHKMKFRSTAVELHKKIEFELLFPISIICPKGSFTIVPKGTNSIFTASLSFIINWLFRSFMKSRVEAIKIHMREEGENLKKLIENEAI